MCGIYPCVARVCGRWCRAGTVYLLTWAWARHHRVGLCAHPFVPHLNLLCSCLMFSSFFFMGILGWNFHFFNFDRHSLQWCMEVAHHGTVDLETMSNSGASEHWVMWIWQWCLDIPE